jgi:putative acetyltransferase
MIEIIDYNDEYAAIFKTLNLEWLDKYNLTEEHDLLFLNHPREEILEKNGFIYLAKDENDIVGTAALLYEGDDVYELAKMSVTVAAQGKGISKLLIEKCIATAKNVNARKVILYSNSQLKAALALYEKYGFKYLPAEDSPYDTADIKMELAFN